MKVLSCRSKNPEVPARRDNLTFEEIKSKDGVYRCSAFHSYFISIEGAVLRYEAGVGVFNAERGGWDKYDFRESDALLCMEIKDAV